VDQLLRASPGRGHARRIVDIDVSSQEMVTRSRRRGRLAADLELADCVDFRGWIADQDELRRLVAAADVAVEPCPSNAFTTPANGQADELLGVGRPIVAFDLPEHRETTGDAAVLVAPDLGAEDWATRSPH